LSLRLSGENAALPVVRTEAKIHFSQGVCLWRNRETEKQKVEGKECRGLWHAGFAEGGGESSIKTCKWGGESKKRRQTPRNETTSETFLHVCFFIRDFRKIQSEVPLCRRQAGVDVAFLLEANSKWSLNPPFISTIASHEEIRGGVSE